MLPRFSCWLALAGAVIVADFVSKAWMLAAFQPHESVVVLPFFNRCN
jgi:lipoprotein signal peptidase